VVRPEIANHQNPGPAPTPADHVVSQTEPIKTMPLNQEIMTRTPAGRWGSPDEFAGPAVFLASRASDFVTGATIFIDGGYAIR
jgi:2-dehydro-3-deoxy-D-gluconate 5-dehydrogenase